MKGKSSKVSANRESLENGIAVHKSNPLFARLDGYIYIRDKNTMGKKSAAYVDSGGTIYLNQDMSLTPSQWAYAIAHCQLHLAFGHFDGEKMPGYDREDAGGKETRELNVVCNQYIWNVACDIYIAKFLHDIKFGTPLSMASVSVFPGPVTDERKIYQYLIERG